MPADRPEPPSVAALPLEVRAPALAAVLAEDADVGSASTWQGRFADGWTPEEMNVALPALARALGVQLAVLWDFRDMFGFGGDSDLVAVLADSTLARAPLGAYRFLRDGGIALRVVGRQAGEPLEPHVTVAQLPSVWGANLARRYAPQARLR